MIIVNKGLGGQVQSLPSRAPSWKLSPTEMKKVGTPDAIPIVY